MANKWAKGEFIPKNPEKYFGKGKICYRSSWEWAFMNSLDSNSNVIAWASESIRIPYMNPATKQKSSYVPDFLIQYVDKNGNKITEMIEIKPKGQTTLESAGRSSRNKAAAIINQCKWAAAAAWCKANNINFRVLTEEQLFAGKK